MLPSSNSHVRADDNGSRTGRFFDKFKVTSKRSAPSQDAGASPFSLAQRLRTLLDAHPVNSPPPRFQPLPTPETSPVAGPSNQSPESSISSPTAFFSAPSSPADAELAALLSSPILPNSAIPFDLPPSDPPVAGTVNQAHTPTPLSPSRVFNILDRIGSPRARARRLSRVADDGRQSIHASPRVWPVSPAMSSISSVLASGSVTAAYGSDGIREIEEEATDDDDDDDTSIMMYSPLMPTPASLVSIAESEISVVAVHEESEDEEETEPVQDTPPPPAPEPQPPEQTQTSGWGMSKLWPFSSWFSSSSQNTSSTPANSSQPPAATPRPQRSVVPVPRPTSTQVRLRRRRVWVPSRTQLSLETMWWGYRIYIPPPVLEALDSTSVETTRRAALLTAALTWFFTNFPVNVLPITVRPVIIILQGLVPYLGYLGSILSWSWGSIRSYDEGYGIILTATWLVPIALIPSTWVPPSSEWPGSPLSTTSAPLSPTTFSTLSSMSQSTSPTVSQSTMTPTPMPPSSLPSSPYLPLQQEQSPELPQGQFYPIYSPAFVPRSPSLPLTQQYTQGSLDQAQQQSQPYPVYSPYSQTTMLSPLTQLSASFPPPPMNFSSFGYAYGYPFPTTSQTPPIMAMSMTSPISTTNGAVVFSPAMSPLSFTSSPYTSSSASMTPTPAPASALPMTSTSSMSQRRSRKRDGSLNAPRMSTVPLPTIP